MKISNIFCKATKPIIIKFYIEAHGPEGTKICSNHPGHMTNMSFTPIYDKQPLTIFNFRTNRLMALKLGM